MSDQIFLKFCVTDNFLKVLAEKRFKDQNLKN